MESICFCESHIVSFGPGVLLKIPEKLGYAADNLLCFPSEEEREDIANQGAPFNAVCDTLVIGRVPSRYASTTFYRRVANYCNVQY